MSGREVRRIRYGTILRPAAETAEGRARPETLDGYAVRLAAGWLLLDTGIAAVDPETEAHYAIRRVPFDDALAAAGLRRAEVAVVVNCHRHFDHTGGNVLLPGRPLLVQRAEPGRPIDRRTVLLDGEHEVEPGVVVVPTPGHTPGHQSVLVDDRLLLAGQTHDTASAWSADALALDRPTPGRAPPGWMARLLARGVREVRFAHDAAVWSDDRIGAGRGTPAPWT